MKKIKQHIWKIVFISIFVGILLVILGISLGAKHGVYLDNTGFHLAEDIEYKEVKHDLASFTDLTIDVGNIDIEFVASDSYGLEICSYDNADSILWSIDNNTLKVKSSEVSQLHFLNFDFSHMMNGFRKNYVKIYLPTGIDLNTVFIKTATSNIDIQNLKANSLDVDNSYGNLSMDTVTIPFAKINLKSGNFRGKDIGAEELTISNDYGNVNMEDISSKQLYITTKSGNCFLKNTSSDVMNIKSNHGKIIGSHLVSNITSVTADSGDIKLAGEFIQETILSSKYGNITFDTTKQKDFYSSDVDTKYGNIVINNESLKDRSSFSNDKEDNRLKVSTDSGNIYLNFDKHE